MVVIVFGLPGSGKSYFASRLATRLGAVYINSDQLRVEIFPVRMYSAEEKNAVYAAMLGIASGRAQQGYSVVMDATFHQASWRQQVAEGLRMHTPCFIEVQADEQIIIDRLKKPREYSEADYAVYHSIKSAWEPMEEDHLILNSSNDSIDEMLRHAMQYLNMIQQAPTI
jgi:predicted kinase